MAGWRDIKSKARGKIHETFEVPATYLTHVEGTAVPCNVRVHTKINTTDMDGIWPSTAGVLEIDPYIIFNATEVPAPLAKSYVIVTDEEIYRIGVSEPRRENFIKATVTVLSPEDCAELVAAL